VIFITNLNDIIVDYQPVIHGDKWFNLLGVFKVKKEEKT